MDRWSGGQHYHLLRATQDKRIDPRLQTGNITVDIDEASWLTSKELISSNSMSRKIPTQRRRGLARNSDFWDRAGTYCPSLHADDPEAMFRGKPLFLFLLTRLQIPRARSLLFPLLPPSNGNQRRSMGCPGHKVLGKPRDLPSGLADLPTLRPLLEASREDERGWGWLRPELCPLTTSGTHYSYVDLLPVGNRVVP